MSSTSFLGQGRRGHSNLTGRIFKELANKYQKLKAKDIVIQDEGLTDEGKFKKGRLFVRDKLRYIKQITTIPEYKMPVEPDNDKLRFWLKANRTGLFLKDISYVTPEHTIKVNHDRQLCLVDSDGLDVGYLGSYKGKQSSSCYKLSGNGQDSAYVDDTSDLQIKNITTGFNLTAWVKITNFDKLNGHARRIVSKSDDANNAYSLFINPQQKAIFAPKFEGITYAVQTPELTLQTNIWYLIVGTFDPNALPNPVSTVYANAVPSTTTYEEEATETATVTYPSISNTDMWLFCNGLTTITDPNDEEETISNDLGGFAGYCRDIRLWRETVLTQQQVTNFNTNKNTISNIPLGEHAICGYCYGQPTNLTSEESFTTTSFSSTSFNT